MQIVPANKFKPLTPCVEWNEEIQVDFAGLIYDGQKKEIYILVCIDRFSKYSSAKIVKKNPNATNSERFLLKYFKLHGTPRQIRLDQARCLICNAVKTLCEDRNMELIVAPAKRYRAVGLVERLIQTLKRRLGCIEIECGINRFFNVKRSLENIKNQLRIGTKNVQQTSHHSRNISEEKLTHPSHY